jgi:hypothetical protein
MSARSGSLRDELQDAPSLGGEAVVLRPPFGDAWNGASTVQKTLVAKVIVFTPTTS